MLLAVEAEIELLGMLATDSQLALEEVQGELDAFLEKKRFHHGGNEREALELEIEQISQLAARIKAESTALRFYSGRLTELDNLTPRALWNAASIARRRADYLHRTMVELEPVRTNELRRIESAIEDVGTDPLIRFVGVLSRSLERRRERLDQETNEAVIWERSRGLYTEATTAYAMASTTVLMYDAARDALDMAARELAGYGVVE